MRWLHSFNVTAEFKHKNLPVTTMNYKCMIIYDMARVRGQNYLHDDFLLIMTVKLWSTDKTSGIMYMTKKKIVLSIPSSSV